MQKIFLSSYRDENNNTINYDGPLREEITILFRGGNNTLTVPANAKLRRTFIQFDCNNGVCQVGDTNFMGQIRVGEDCVVMIGDSVTTTGQCFISTAEGSKVVIGQDCMIAGGVEIRSDDSHAIYDIFTDNRTNPSKDIIIGEHVWIGERCGVLGGAKIGNGSVLGFGSVVKGRIPNNVVAVGSPARVVRKDIAWERPHLNMAMPYYKPKPLGKSRYWNPTLNESGKIPLHIRIGRGVSRRLKRLSDKIFSGARS